MLNKSSNKTSIISQFSIIYLITSIRTKERVTSIHCKNFPLIKVSSLTAYSKFVLNRYAKMMTLIDNVVHFISFPHIVHSQRVLQPTLQSQQSSQKLGMLHQHFQMHSKMIVWIIYFKIKASISILNAYIFILFQNMCILILFQNVFQNEDEPNAFCPISKWKWR